MTRVLVYAIPVVLAVWALVDLVQTASARARFMPRFVWAIAIIGIPVVGPLVWLVFGAQRRRRGVPGGTPQPPRTLGPDDDPDFLRGIDQQRRDEQRRRSPGATPPVDPSGSRTSDPTGSRTSDPAADHSGDPSGGPSGERSSDDDREPREPREQPETP